jgi:hypothetical protein
MQCYVVRRQSHVNINISTKLHKDGKEWEHKVQQDSAGHAIAQTVSRWLPIGRPGFEPGGQIDARARFLRVLRFLLPIFIPPIAPQSPSSIIWGWYNRPVVAAVTSGLSLTLLRTIKNK